MYHGPGEWGEGGAGRVGSGERVGRGEGRREEGDWSINSNICADGMTSFTFRLLRI